MIQAVTPRAWRDMRRVDHAALNETLLSSSLVTNPATDTDQYAMDIARIVVGELDKVAPLRVSRQVRRDLPADQFLTPEARQSIRDCRRLRDCGQELVMS